MRLLLHRRAIARRVDLSVADLVPCEFNRCGRPLGSTCSPSFDKCFPGGETFGGTRTMQGETQWTMTSKSLNASTIALTRGT